MHNMHIYIYIFIHLLRLLEAYAVEVSKGCRTQKGQAIIKNAALPHARFDGDGISSTICEVMGVPSFGCVRDPA